MSTQTGIQYGYGVITSKIKITDIEKLKSLLLRLPDYKAEINEYFKNENITTPTISDYLDYMEGDYGIAEILEKIIYKEEGLELCSCNDCEGNSYLLYPATYPWYLSKLDFSMTEDKLKAIFEKYIRLLTDESINITYQSCENYA